MNEILRFDNVSMHYHSKQGETVALKDVNFSVNEGEFVAIIGLSLAGNAIGDLQTAPAGGSSYVAILCGLVTLAVTMLCATFGKKMIRLIPFIMGILAGYAVAAIFTIIGLRMDFYHVPKGEPEEKPASDGSPAGTKEEDSKN